MDAGGDIVVDSLGCAYLPGLTSSTDFPIYNPYDASSNGDGDVFVTKLSPAGNVLLYSTYIGGSRYDEVSSIAIDGSGCAYVTGETYSVDFPMQNPFDHVNVDSTDAFVTKLSADGSTLEFSTYLGGYKTDRGGGIAVDDDRCAYVVGYTASLDFPLLDAYDYTLGGNVDAFVTKISASGSELIYSTFLGSSSYEFGEAIAIDASGRVYVTGSTHASGFPTQNPYDASYNGGLDVFVAGLTAAGDELVYGTYLGGAGDEDAASIAVTSTGDVCVTGHSTSLDFPMYKSFDSVYNGGASDVFVSRLSTTGNGLVYSSYIGGGDSDAAYAIAVDTSGYAYLTGYTKSLDFPTEAPYDGNANGEEDAFVTKLATVSCCTGVTGNVNLIGIVDLSDLSALVSYLTGGGFVLPCPDEANVNASGIVDLSDLSALVSYLTGGGYILPPCP